jgi:hypothetical protein
LGKTKSLKYCGKCGKATTHYGTSRGLGDWDATCSKCGAYSKHEHTWGGYTIYEDKIRIAGARRGFD